MIVKHQVIVAKVRPADMPVKIFGFEIQRKGISQQCVQRSGDVLGGIGAEVGGTCKRRFGDWTHGEAPQE
jgi:hypothetical protein